MRVDDFLRAAERLFSVKGVYHTTMEDIARAAEYGTGTIYRYFESKEELYGALLHRKLAGYFEHLQGTVEAARGARERLRALIHGKFEFFRENHEFLRIYIRDVIPHAESLKAGLNPEAMALRERCLGMTREAVEEGVATGEFKAVDPDWVVNGIAGLTNELLLVCFREREGRGLEELEAFVMDWIERGLLAEVAR